MHVSTCFTEILGHRGGSLWPLTLAILASSGAALPQDAFEGDRSAMSEPLGGLAPMRLVVMTFEGLVIDANGAPVAGAVVVSSAGGQASTDDRGRYSLETRTPVGASSLRLTAVAPGGGNLLASRELPLQAAPGAVLIDPLQLSSAATCAPGWLPTFGPLPGVDGQVRALAVFDDGSGPALYVGGSFDYASDLAARGIARWDGSDWTSVGGGVDASSWTGAISTIRVFDDGNGDALYVGGDFTSIGGVSAAGIAKWDGSTWMAMGSSLFGVVSDLELFDAGSGEELYACGEVTVAGSPPGSDGVARWDGTDWSVPGTSIWGHVRGLQVFDDGSGAKLYAGGDFRFIGGVPYNYIACWDGISWSTVGAGMSGSVYGLAVFDSGNGDKLFAGGTFITAGGVSVSRVASWDGTIWADLAGGMDDTVTTLSVLDDGSGAALYAGGLFSDAGGVAAGGIAKWDGADWNVVGSGSGPGSALVFTTFDDGGGPALYAGGEFSTADGKAAKGIAKLEGSAWEGIGAGLTDRVRALDVFDDGSGPVLVAAGEFQAVGSVPTESIATWNGQSWEPLGSGVDGAVYALAVHDDGAGPALYAGGDFTTAGGLSAPRVAKWDGSSWGPVGGGVSDIVFSLLSFDDGSGPALYAGGGFRFAEGNPASRIAKWDGSNWTALGAGTNKKVLTLAVYDDGGGEALYAGGEFANAGGVTVKRIAKWDGTEWSGLAGGLDGVVRTLVVHDDGAGPALFAGGAFQGSASMSATPVARWDGQEWTGLGDAFNFGGRVNALAVFDDGGGEALYAAGAFTDTGGPAANRLAKWSGLDWVPLGGGVSGPALSLATFDDGSGTALYAGGDFASAYDSGDAFLAKWGCDQPNSSSFCSSLPNATGSAAHLTCTGLPGSGLILTSSPVPNTAGQFFFGPSMLQGTPFGDGLLCVGGAMRRMRPFVHAGSGMNPPNTATLAIDYAAPYAAGLTGTQCFQHWFRSGLATGAGFNTSDGLAVTF